MAYLLDGECSTVTTGSTPAGHSAGLPSLSRNCTLSFWLSCFLLSHSISTEAVSLENSHFWGSPDDEIRQHKFYHKENVVK